MINNSARSPGGANKAKYFLLFKRDNVSFFSGDDPNDKDDDDEKNSPDESEEDKIFRAVSSLLLLDKFSCVEDDRTEGRAHLTRRLLLQHHFIIF